MASIIVGNLPFPTWELSSAKANKALGRFVTAWGQVETLCEFIFRALSEVPAHASATIFGYIAVNEQIEIVTVIADDISDTELQEAMKEVKTLSVRRNRIIHARWGTLDGAEARFWRGLTAQHIMKIATGASERLRRENVFTLAELEALTNQATGLRDRLVAIHDRLSQTSGIERRIAMITGHVARLQSSSGKSKRRPPS